MIYSDIGEVKSLLNIDPSDTIEDKNILFYIEWASRIIEEYLNRPGLTYASRTEYYGGSGTQKLLLKSRPVFVNPTIQVFLDEGGFYGSVSGAFTQSDSQLTYGVDFCLDTLDGISSRSGILIRTHDFWPKPAIRQQGYLSPFIGQGFGAIKVIYTAGYTVDTLPPQFRAAADLLVSKLRYVFPLGVELGGESYEDRSISVVANQKGYLMSLVKPLLFTFRNWVF